jgi:hypothetical protein
MTYDYLNYDEGVLPTMPLLHGPDTKELDIQMTVSWVGLALLIAVAHVMI